MIIQEFVTCGLPFQLAYAGLCHANGRQQVFDPELLSEILTNWPPEANGNEITFAFDAGSLAEVQVYSGSSKLRAAAEPLSQSGRTITVYRRQPPKDANRSARRRRLVARAPAPLMGHR